MEVKIYNESNNPLPKYETQDSSGMDIRANITQTIRLDPLERALIPTGLYLQLPRGIEAQVRARSGLALKQGLSLVNGIGTIDSDYRGEIKVILVNLSNKVVEIHNGDRIAQIVFAQYLQADILPVKGKEELENTKRGSGGFGHTGL